MRILLADIDLAQEQQDLCWAEHRTNSDFLIRLIGDIAAYKNLWGWVVILTGAGMKFLTELQACPQPAGAR